MTDAISYEHIDQDSQLAEFCDRAKNSGYIGFDTEFVSENRYRPELCLLQVATDTEIVIIDALEINDVGPFWEMLVTGDHITVAHAAREEFLFCLRACGQRPKNLFDVQLAAGFVGLEYPASYANLVSQILGEHVAKGETRTDWKRRPLSDKQIQYALSDVLHLNGLYTKIKARLDKLGRAEWLYGEMSSWLDNLEQSETEPQWQKVSGITSLNQRSLAIVRELWICRNREAKRRNRSPKRVLPDDLIVELAKRGSASESSFKAIRGFENRVSRGVTKDIALAINEANELPKESLPRRLPRSRTMNLGLLGQFLTTALSIVCRDQKIAPAIVGTAQEVRMTAAWRLGILKLDQTPELASGWRAEIVGQLIDQILAGEISIRVGNPKSDSPLIIEGYES